MNEDQNLATQDEIDGGSQVGEDAAEGGGAAGGSPSQWSLKVNDRTVYNSPDEARRGFEEAHKTITSLSGLRSTIEEFVGKGAATNELVKSLLQEVVENRKAAAAKKNTSSSGDGDDPRFEGKSQDEIRQIKQADKWFEDQAKKRGYVTQDSLKELKDKLASLESMPEKQFEAANTEAVQKGREWLEGALRDAKVVLNDAEMKRFVGRITAYVDGDDELVGRWQNAVKSGNRGEQTAILKEAAEFSLPSIKAGASLKPATTNTTRTKTQIMQRTAKPMPQVGTGKTASNDRAPNGIRKPTGLRAPDLTQAALDYISRRESAE